MKLPLLPGQPRPLLLAHRGLSAEAPENTLAAFRLAAERGIPGIELDVHLTADGELAVIHDHHTGRVSPSGPGGVDGRGLEVERSTRAELRSLDVGSWKLSRWAGERIPWLGELLEEMGSGVYVDIELKNASRGDYGLEAAVAACLRATAPDGDAGSRFLVSSFNPIALARFKALSPKVPTAIIWCDHEYVPHTLRDGQGRWIGKVDALKPSREKVGSFSSFLWRRIEGYPVLPWIVDDPHEARRLVDLGCEGIISNEPGRIGFAPAGSR
ncbi:MAG: glycerophosphodiester phosphodiesterase family protein [Spirochaetaceae bacterium]|nr:glycerophosphodiester phosphodiesterase family protein [Spirochaetaceae bacterium]